MSWILVLASVGTVVFVYMLRPENSGQTQQVPATQPEVQKVVATNMVSIQNYSFSPQAITVEKGKTVMWTNNDVVAHTLVFSDSIIAASGSLNEGAGFSLAFDHPGTFTYHSAAYPDVTGSVTVTD